MNFRKMTTPLIDEYRKKANFDVQLLQNLIEGEDHISMKKKIVEKMKTDPLFHRDYRILSREENRELVHHRWKRIIEWDLFKDPYTDLPSFQALSAVLESFDQGTSARLLLHANVFGAAIKSMGTERHWPLVEKCERNEIVGAFCLTEIGHGSNTAEVQTTATFADGHLIFDTPSVSAIKCWAGNLAHSATHIVVFAQLHVGGKNQGFHGFVLQVRDLQTFAPLPGITIGDMGSKPGGWQGVENGWIEFKNHRAPLTSLLNKGCDITEDGRYVTSFKSAGEKQSVSLGTLSVGRIGIIGKGVNACTSAATIAIRYSVARRQFGPTSGAENEIPVLEYPLQQYRLFPYLASAICMRIFQKRLFEHFTEYMIRVMQGEKSEELAEFAKEVHAISSSAKPVSTWLGVEALGEARKACGGHGFLHASRLNTLRDDNDPSQTFEGENFMILQQTSNILLAKARNRGTVVNSPMETMSFFNSTPKRFQKWSDDLVQDVLDAYSFLIHHLLERTSQDAAHLKSAGRNTFEVRNEIQVHRAVNLSIAYCEHTMIDWCNQFVNDVEDPASRKVLRKVLELYSLFIVERHLATLYIGGYASTGSFGEDLRKKLRTAVADLKDEAIALVDVIAPDDFLLHSALGSSDGKAYENLINEFRKYTNEQPPWICDLAQFLQRNSQKSKL